MKLEPTLWDHLATAWLWLKVAFRDLYYLPLQRQGDRVRRRIYDDCRPPFLPLYLTSHEWRALAYVQGQPGSGFVMWLPTGSYAVVQSWPMDGFAARVRYFPSKGGKPRRSPFVVLR